MQYSRIKNFILNIVYPILFLYVTIVKHLFKIKIFGTKETLTKIIDDEYSISRFGDGELALLNNKNLQYQNTNNILCSKLKKVLQNNQKTKIIIGIPYALVDVSELSYTSKKFWIKYTACNYMNIFRLLNKNKVYYDSQITRIYINRKNKSITKKYFEMWKKVWDGKNLLIVEGEFTRFGINNDLLDNANSVQRIICPSKNAFDYYDDIKKAIVDSKENKLILIILGPTATIMTYELAEIGIRSLDIGNLDIEYEWYLRGVENKVIINNKYNSEIENMDNQQFSESLKFKDDIIRRIGC